MRILVAEDDLVSRKLLETMLTKWGFQVISTENGLSACAALQDVQGPRLALLDWMMPGIDGIEVCRRVRSVPSSVPPYLVLLTARECKEDIVAGLINGANDYLIKPFDRN